MTIQHLINGKAVASAATFETINPATQEALAEVAAGGEAEIAAAVEAAKEAFPKWAGMPAKQRAKIMRRLGELIEANVDSLAAMETEDTGLPMVVWVSQRGNARHDARVKVSLTHGRRFSVGRTASVAIRPTVRQVAGSSLAAADLQAVTRWIELNRKTLLDYWDEKLSTREMLAQIQKI